MSSDNTSPAANATSPAANTSSPTANRKIWLKSNCKPEPQHKTLPTLRPPKHFHQFYSSNRFVKLPGHQLKNHLINTAIAAYNLHLGLNLSPDDLQENLCAIVCQIVNFAPEDFRDLFVNHEGKKTIRVGLQTLSPQELDQMLLQFREKIFREVKTPEIGEIFSPQYSTTTPVRQLVAASQLMATTKEYFHYLAYFMCGLPFVRLSGTPDDWRSLIAKTRLVAQLLGDKCPSAKTYFIDTMIPILENIYLTTIQSPEDEQKLGEFWGTILNHRKWGSGHQIVFGGWFSQLFPGITLQNANGEDYDEEDTNDKPLARNIKVDGVNGMASYPSRLAVCDIDLLVAGHHYQTTLTAGFIGTEQRSDGSLKVISGGYLDLKTQPEPPTTPAPTQTVS